MRIVVALGGNALLRRGEPITADVQRANTRVAAEALAQIHSGNEIVITHGNGPEVGLPLLEAPGNGVGSVIRGSSGAAKSQNRDHGGADCTLGDKNWGRKPSGYSTTSGP